MKRKETGSEHISKPILNVGEENMEESERSEQVMTETSGTKAKTFYRNVYASVALTEIQSDKIDTEFTQALKETVGERGFSCSQREKVWTSKRGGGGGDKTHKMETP